MKTFLLLILSTIVLDGFSQDWPVKKSVIDKKATGYSFQPLQPFTFVANKIITGRGSYQELKLDPSFSKRLLEEQTAAIVVSFPISATEKIICELVKFELGNIKFTQNNNSIIEDVKIPITYRGVVQGEDKRNNVMLTVNENYISLIVTFHDRAIQITKADEPDHLIYRLYNSQQVQFPNTSFECGTEDKPISFTELTAPSRQYAHRTDSSQSKCVSVFVDCFDSLYQWKNNSIQQSIDYVYELFTAVATGYANEKINIQIINVNVWTTADPFRGDNRTNALADLAATYKDSFWGNICVGLDFSLNSPVGTGRSGLAGEIGKAKAVSPKACPAYAIGSNQFCYCDMNYNVSVQNFPTGPNTTAQQIYLTMHEMGHLLGSRHTKWCGWKLSSSPDTYGALDSCGGMEAINNTTPVCSPGAPPPATGATIMSYCVSGNAAGQFVNFNNGFGTLPGNAIRDFVDKSFCIPTCADCTISFNDNNTKNTATPKTADVAVKNSRDHKLFPGINAISAGTQFPISPFP